METAAICNRAGFTLIEFLVAIVILMVGLLGLLQTVNYALSHNAVNQLRQQAINLADEQVQLEKAKLYENIAAPEYKDYPTPLSFDQLSSIKIDMPPVTINNKQYSIKKISKSPTRASKYVQIEVEWQYKQTNYDHRISTLVSNNE